MKRSMLTTLAAFAFLGAATPTATLLLTETAAASAAAAARDEDARPYDRWYVVEIDGSRAGWMRESFSADGDHLKTSTSMEMSIRRGRASVSVAIESDFIETAEGEPVSARYVQRLGTEPVVQEFTFGKDRVQIRARQGDVAMPPSEAPMPGGGWLTPREVREFIAARLAAGAEEIAYKTLDPSGGLKVVSMRHKVLERTTADVLGRTVPAIKWQSTSSLTPGIETTDYVDLTGVPIRSEINLGMLTMTTILADRDLAMAEVAPPELLVSTLVTPDRPISEPREAKRAVYVLSVPEGELGDLPESSVQRVERLGPDRLRLTVDLAQPVAAPEEDAENGALLAATAMADANDEEVKALVSAALRGKEGAGAAAKAEALRRFVHRHIDEKNLDVGFGTASETARTRAGDCTEHGTLLVAMLRSAGIPARACSGLIYVNGFAGKENVFGYHMWAQALLEQEAGEGGAVWVDLDATLGPQTPSDATHILLATSELGDAGIDNALVNLAPLLGRLAIEVEEVE